MQYRCWKFNILFASLVLFITICVSSYAINKYAFQEFRRGYYEGYAEGWKDKVHQSGFDLHCGQYWVHEFRTMKLKRIESWDRFYVFDDMEDL